MMAVIGVRAYFEVFESLPPEGEKTLSDPSAFISEDDWGKVYSRRRSTGQVPLMDDGSTRVQIPGGLPIVLEVMSRLAGEENPSWHHQREAVQYYPGEWVTLSFRRELYNGFCAGCHGANSGRETDFAANPDILTQASAAEAKSADPVVLDGAPRVEAIGAPYP